MLHQDSKHIHLLGQSLQFGDLRSVLESDDFIVTTSDTEVPDETNLLVIGDNIGPDHESINAVSEHVQIVTLYDIVYHLTKDKQRIVVTGTSGSLKIINILIHVMDYYKRDYDYFLKEELPINPSYLKITDAPIFLVQGLDQPKIQYHNTPDFISFNHHIGVINNIDWNDGIPLSEEEYLSNFEKFADKTPKGGSLIYSTEDPLATMVGSKERTDVYRFPYEMPKFNTENHSTVILVDNQSIEVPLYKEEDLVCLSAATALLKRFGIDEEHTYTALSSFQSNPLH